jgi:hypothetical protein
VFLSLQIENSIKGYDVGMIKLIPEGCFPCEGLLTHVSRMAVVGIKDDLVPLISSVDFASEISASPSGKGAVCQRTLDRYSNGLSRP